MKNNEMFTQGLYARWLYGTPHQAARYIAQRPDLGSAQDLHGYMEGIYLLASLPHFETHKSGLFVDLEKGEKPYGHVGYNRMDPRSGHLVHVDPKGIKPHEPPLVVAVKAPEPEIKTDRPSKEKPEQIRWAKRLDQPIPVTLADSADLDAVSGAFFKLCKKQNVTTLAEWTDTLRAFLVKTGNETDTPAEFVKLATTTFRAWLDAGIIDAPRTAAALEQPKPPKKEKRRLWTKLHNPGLVLPPPYKHKGIMPNKVAEEMGWAVSRYLLSEDPAARMDEVFLKNFTDDLAFHAGVKCAPTIPALKKLFGRVMKARLKAATTADKTKAKKPHKGPKSIETHPMEFALKDGQPDKMETRSAALLSGYIFTGNKNDDLGVDARNKHRGRWSPATEYKDIMLNGSSYPKGWETKLGGRVTNSPDKEYYIAVRVPEFVKKEKIIYLRPENLQGKLEEKWAHVKAFSDAYPKIREKFQKDLFSPDPKKREIALACVCLDTFYPRIDSDSKTEGKDRFGLMALQAAHIWTKVERTGTAKPEHQIHFKFAAKGFDAYDSEHMGPGVVETPFLKALDILNSLKANKKPTDRLFSITDDDVNKYLREVEPHAKAHHFRHFHANRLFALALKKHQGEILKVRRKAGKKWSRKVASKAFNDLLEMAGKKLGHRLRRKDEGAALTGVGTVRDNYLHPSLIVQAMHIVGYDLRTKDEAGESMYAGAEGLEKSLLSDLGLVFDEPVYTKRYIGMAPQEGEQDVIAMMNGDWSPATNEVEPWEDEA